MESRDGEEEAAGADWTKVQGLENGEAAGKTPSPEEEVTLGEDRVAVFRSTVPVSCQLSLALCTLTNAGFFTPGFVIRCRPVGLFDRSIGGMLTAFPVSADS
jgi:hypothetical protein